MMPRTWSLSNNMNNNASSLNDQEDGRREIEADYSNIQNELQANGQEKMSDSTVLPEKKYSKNKAMFQKESVSLMNTPHELIKQQDRISKPPMNESSIRDDDADHGAKI